MQTTGAFIVYDSKSKTHTFPRPSNNIETARREFQRMVNDPKSGYLYDFPEDYTLYYIGEWDELEGQFALSTNHQAVCTAVQAKGDVLNEEPLPSDPERAQTNIENMIRSLPKTKETTP